MDEDKNRNCFPGNRKQIKQAENRTANLMHMIWAPPGPLSHALFNFFAVGSSDSEAMVTSEGK